MAKQYVVPMFESERGWGSKIDGYAGPFPDKQDATVWQAKYNLNFNNLPYIPDYYISALDPVEYKGQKCDYNLDCVYL